MNNPTPQTTTGNYKLAVYDRYGNRTFHDGLKTFDIAKHAADVFMASVNCMIAIIRDEDGQLIYAADRHEEYCAP